MAIRYRTFFVSLAVLAIAPLIAVGGMVRDFLSAAFSWLGTPEDWPGLALAGDGGSALYTGTPLDPALQNSLRHEAKQDKRSAARGI